MCEYECISTKSKKKQEKKGLQGVPPETAQKIELFKEMLQKYVQQLRSKKYKIIKSEIIKKRKKNKKKKKTNPGP